MRGSITKGLYSALTLLIFVLAPPTALTGGSDKGASERVGVSFSGQILPILQEHCLVCHVPGKEGYEASALDVSTYDSLMKGTKFGPVITPGSSISSTLVTLVEGHADPSINMPHGDRPPLRAAQIRLVRQWIDEGAMNN